MASSYDISGTGFASANTIGCSAIDCIMSFVRTLPFERPTNTSAPLTASSRLCTSRRSVAKSFFCSVRLSRSLVITPFESSITMFSFFAPSATYIFVHDIAAAPAPLTTIFTFEISFPLTSRAFLSPAAEIMAVPC